MLIAQHDLVVVVDCPNGHGVAIPKEPGVTVSGGVSVERRSIADEYQDCPVCGPFRRHSDGTVALHITIGSPRTVRPIAWCVSDLTYRLHKEIPAETKRIAMADSGALRTFLETFRIEYEKRGVDFDMVVDEIVAHEELVSIHPPEN